MLLYHSVISCQGVESPEGFIEGKEEKKQTAKQEYDSTKS